MSFFCLRIPRFPSWDMAQVNPSLAPLPFAICEAGKVISPSPRAFAGGVTSGMSAGKAQSRLSDLHIIARDKSVEALAWHEVQYQLYGLTPKIESIRPGLLYCDVEPAKVATLLSQWDGGCHWVGAGYAGDRATAHIAAMLAPPATTRVIPAGKDWEHIGKIPLQVLDGEIHPETIGDLAFFGWTTLSSIRPLTRRQLEEQFDGRAYGEDGAKLFRFAQGAKCDENLRPVPNWREPEQITARLAFEFPAQEPCEWERGLLDALTLACAELGTRSAQSLEVTIETPIAPFASRRVLREPASNPKALIQPLKSALLEALRLMQPLPAIIQAIEVKLGNLVVPQLQPELWEDPKATRVQKLTTAFERLESRLPGKLYAVAPQQPDSPFEEEQFGWLSALEKLGVKRHAKSTR